VISNERGKENGIITTLNKIYVWTFGAVATSLAAIFYQGNLDRNQKLWNIVSTENYKHFNIPGTRRVC